jgi:transglutaminase-like putative cysteine protease
MRLSVDHVTHYRFDRPQRRLVQLLRLRPTDSDQQTVASWRIDVDCDARLKTGRDGFGNTTTMLYAEGPIEEIEISVAGEVLTSGPAGMVTGIDEMLPPPLFLRTTRLTAGDAALRNFAEKAGGAMPKEIAERLTDAVHERFSIDSARPVSGRTAADAFTDGAGTPRDMAHVLIAALRIRRVPARYVSGYSLRAPECGPRAGPHGWVETHVEGRGWGAIDPSTGAAIDEGYVRVAAALDAAGAAAVAGSRAGSGEEVLDVDLTVERLGGEE